MRNVLLGAFSLIILVAIVAGVLAELQLRRLRRNRNRDRPYEESP